MRVFRGIQIIIAGGGDVWGPFDIQKLVCSSQLIWLFWSELEDFGQGHKR